MMLALRVPPSRSVVSFFLFFFREPPFHEFIFTLEFFSFLQSRREREKKGGEIREEEAGPVTFSQHLGF